MKMLVLTVPILAALGARVVLAESEGGDTWSAVETVQKSTYSVLQHTPQLDSSRPTLDDPFVGSEGGDTWSSVQALGDTTVQLAHIQDRPDRTGTKYAGQFAASEGGDTWSRFVPQFQSQPAGSADIASAHNGANDH